MIYYHISIEEDQIEAFEPRVPQSLQWDTLDTQEDTTTKRVCLCPTIEGCLQALTRSVVEDYILGEGVDYLEEGGKVISYTAIPQLVNLYIFEIDNSDENLVSNNHLVNNRLVADAHLTGEVWYTSKLVPKETVALQVGSVTYTAKEVENPVTKVSSRWVDYIDSCDYIILR